MMVEKSRETYGEEDVAQVHEAHDQTADASEVVRVAGDDERTGDNVVGHHLPVIFSRGLRVDDEEQVEVKCGLHHVVEFYGAWEGYVGVAGPKVGGKVHIDILRHLARFSLVDDSMNQREVTYKTHRPRETVIDSEPALLCKAYRATVYMASLWRVHTELQSLANTILFQGLL